tara:strand:+ start:3289 stop:4041 length:753 start_codon:yes stop_codon:yes gene_type:complete
MTWKAGDKFAIVIVGDEFTRGESEEQNGPWIARQLVNYGFNIELCIQLSDNPDSLHYWLSQMRASSVDHIIVSGGIGGTHDDYTRQSIAAALDVPIEIHLECLRILEEKYGDRLNDQRRRMSHLPSGSELINNPQGAPGFQVSNLTALPGFPRMVKSMLPELLTKSYGQTNSMICTTAYFPNLTEGDIAVQVEDFYELWSEYVDSLGIYPDSTQGVRAVSLKLRYSSKHRRDLVDEFTKLVGSLGGTIVS